MSCEHENCNCSEDELVKRRPAHLHDNGESGRVHGRGGDGHGLTASAETERRSECWIG